jgi:hypothetical protein
MAMGGWNGIMKGWSKKLIQLLRMREAKKLQALELALNPARVRKQRELSGREGEV